MVQGVTAPRPRHSGVGPRIALPLFIFIAAVAPPTDSILASSVDSEPRLKQVQQQTTFAPPIEVAVAPQFDYETVLAGRLDGRSRFSKPQHQSFDLIYQSFDFESVLGSSLDKRNHLTNPKHLTALAQTTHVAAAFSQDMVAGVTAPRPRILTPRTIGLPDLVFIEPFSFDSVLSGSLDRRNHLSYPIHVPPIAQTTHVAATFSVAEMVVSGSTVTRARLPKITQLAVPDLPHVLAFSFESVLGSKLDSRNHLTYPQWLAPIAQPTHVSAAFSTEMAAGAQGVQFPSPRLHLGARIPQPLSQTTPVAAAFSQDMVAGVTAPQPRILIPRRIAQPDWVFIEPCSFDSVLSSRLDFQSRLRRPQHLAPISQTTHVQAAFSPEMILGSKLDPRTRLHIIQRPPQTPLVQDIRFAFESILGSQLDRRGSRFRPAVHLQPLAQTTHVAAPFSIEMARGSAPHTGRQPVIHSQTPIPDVIIIDPFSLESVFGYGPVSPRLPRITQPNLPDLVFIPFFRPGFGDSRPLTVRRGATGALEIDRRRTPLVIIRGSSS